MSALCSPEELILSSKMFYMTMHYYIICGIVITSDDTMPQIAKHKDSLIFSIAIALYQFRINIKHIAFRI